MAFINFDDPRYIALISILLEPYEQSEYGSSFYQTHKNKVFGSPTNSVGMTFRKSLGDM